jgi:hypothetical protein
MKAYDSDDLLKEVRTELDDIASNGTQVWARQEQARVVRFNEWEGQSTDGRKHFEDLGEEALPFEGAPDNRIPLVDSAINEKVVIAKRAFFRGVISAKPTESGDAARAANVASLVGWLRDRKMKRELDVEVELSAQHMFGDDPGMAVVEVSWLRDLALVRRTLSFDELATMFATGVQDPNEVQAGDPRLDEELLGEFMDLATNPKRQSEWAQWLGAMFPGATPRALKAAATELKKTGFAELPVPAMRENRPRVQTLRYMDDVFFPLGTADIQRSRSIHRREWVSEVELRERVHTLGWDASTVEDVLARGKGQSFLTTPYATLQNRNMTSGAGRGVNERDNLFEIIWSYRREADELGIPGIGCIVWNCVVRDGWLKRDVAEYPDGEYPFVLKPREQLDRSAAASRGISVPISTHQTEMKIQRDARGVAVQMAASPPIKTKMRTGAYELVLGPNSQIPVQGMEDFDVVKMPSFTQESVEMERTAKTEASDYCGLMRVDADQNRVGMMQQDEAEKFSAFWGVVFSKVLGFAQNYYSDEELARVTGQGDVALKLTPEDVRGGWDVAIEIDARDLNMEFATKKMKAYGELLGLDSGGDLDRSGFIKWAAYAIDPILAKQTVQAAGVVTKKLIDEERANVQGMALGIEPMMNPDGTTNPQFRLQTAMQTISQSPRLSQLFQADPIFQELVINYQKYLVQQLTQEENKLVGRLGTAPTQGVPGLYDASVTAPAGV